MKEQVWMVRAGRAGMYAGEFLQRNMVAIGWGLIGDLERIHTRLEVAALLHQHFFDYTTFQTAMNTGQIFRFREELCEGSTVITYVPEERAYKIGTIIGPYAYHPEFNEELQHTRAVSWYATMARDELSVETKSLLGSISTIFRISEEASTELLARATNDHSKTERMTDSGAEEAPMKLEEQEAEVENRKNVEQRALEFLQDRLSQLAWDEMQELVAGLLRAMGYKTRVSPPGADRGRDIVASPDGFGFQAPRVLVEVKHRKGTMGAPEIRAFLGGLRSGDNGLFVSSGGFTREARYEADRANHHLALMDSDELARSLMEHYDKVDVETKAILPLKKIYWPA